MSKEKQARRMIAMALAASMVTSVVPVTAFAEGSAPEGESNKVTNADGSVTETTTNSDGTTTEKTTGSSGEGTPAAPTVSWELVKEKDQEGNTTEVKKTEKTSSSSTDENNNTTQNTKVEENWASGTEVPADDEEDSSDDNSGEGEVEKTNAEKSKEFGENFGEPGTSSTTTSGTTGSQTSTNKTVTDENGNVLEDSGAVKGSETTTTTTTTVVKTETILNSTLNDPNNKPVLADKQPEKPVHVDEGDGDKTALDNVGNPVLPDTVVDESNLTAEEKAAMEDEKDISASITATGTVTNGKYADGTDAQVTETEKMYADWQKTYEILVQQATDTVTGAAYAEAKTVKDAAGNAVTMGNPNGGTPVVNQETGVTSYEYVSEGETTTDTYKKTVTVIKSTDADGNVSFTTTTTLVVTPKEGTLAGTPTEVPLVDPVTGLSKVEETTYSDYIENKETGEPVVTVKAELPAKPELGPVGTADATGKTMEVVDVKDYYEEINGEQVHIGYEKIVEIKDKDGNVIGTGKEVVKGVVRTTTSTKEVKETTTIDTYTQKTTVTTKEIQKEVTESTVKLNVDQATRELIVKILNANTNYDGTHSQLQNMQSIAPDAHTYGTNWTNKNGQFDDDLWYYAQFWGNLDYHQKTVNGVPVYDENGDPVMVSYIPISDSGYIYSQSKNLSEFANVAADPDKFLLYGNSLFSELTIRQLDDGVPENHTVRQYVFKDENKNDFYAYCVEMGQSIDWGTNYVLENLDEVDYIVGDLEDKNGDGKYDEGDGYTAEQIKAASDEAKAHIRTIALNGFWGTTGYQKDDQGNYVLDKNNNKIPEAGSLEAVKAMLKEANPTYWTDAQLATLSAGQAMSATQAAIWYYGNDNGDELAALDWLVQYSTRSGSWLLDEYGPQGETEEHYDINGDSTKNVAKDNVVNQNVVAMFNTLIGLNTTVAPEEKESNLIDLEDITATITAKEKVGEGKDVNSHDDDVYNTDVSFTLALIPTENDELYVVIQKEGAAEGEDPILQRINLNEIENKKQNGDSMTYTIANIHLAEGVNINLNIDGMQHLKNGVYVYRSENFDTSNTSDPHSQTMVGIASGQRSVSLDMNLTFFVDDPENATVTGNKSGYRQSKTDTTTTTENYVKHDQIVSALMEVTTTTVTTASREWDGSYSDTWSPDPTNNNNNDNNNNTVINDNKVPQSDAPVLDEILEEEVPLAEGEMILSDIPQTEDSSHGFLLMSLLSGLGLLMTKKRREEKE